MVRTGLGSRVEPWNEKGMKKMTLAFVEIKFSTSEERGKQKGFPHLLSLTFTCAPQFQKKKILTEYPDIF